MKSITVILLLATCAYGAERTATVSGDWSAKDTWGQAAPGEGDTVVVDDGVTVTVTDARVIGTSGANGTVAINLGKSGAIVIAKGGTLRVRGDVVYTAGVSNTSPAVTVKGGGTWRWDSSKAASPKDTSYKFYQSDELGLRPFVLDGTAQAHAVYDSDPSGGHAYMTRSGKTYGGVFKSAYGEISNIGDAKTPGWDVGWLGGENHPVTWEVHDTTFTGCGIINRTGWMEKDSVFRHNSNVHADTQAERVFSTIGCLEPLGKGTHEIIGNVFDRELGEYTMLSGFTITGNYFGGGMGLHIASLPWAKCEGNIIRLTRRGDAGVNVSGKRLADSVIFIDIDQDNPHVVAVSPKTSRELDGLIMFQAGTANMDSGEWFGGGGTFAVTRCIIQPNMYGYSSGEMMAITPAFLDAKVTFEHNVWFGGFSKEAAGRPGFPAFQYSEGGNNKPGQVESFRSNILWNPQIQGLEASFVKMLDICSTDRDQGDGLVEDVGDPKNLDYNTGWGYSKDLNFTNIGHFTNQGKGYAGKWSKTPGAHDVDADPQFVDWQRDILLYATKGLGKTASRGQWSAKPDKPYAIGDTVINTTKIEWGLPVMYRYIGSGENPEPGAGTREKGDTAQWRKSWEWASLYYIREGVRTGQKFGDDDVIMHLLQWVRAGYATTNPALKGTAHDGKDIGAVPYQAKVADTRPATPASAASTNN